MPTTQLGAMSSSARLQSESTTTAEGASSSGHRPASSSLMPPAGLEGQRRTAAAATAEPLRRATLPETPGTQATGIQLSNMLEDLLHNVAGRLNAKDAIALSSSNKSLREATGRIAVAKAATCSAFAHDAVRHGLRKARDAPNADTRCEILRSVAGRIGQSEEQPVEWVHAFMRTIGPLPPEDRAAALANLKTSLAQLAESHQPAVFALVEHSVALQQVDTLHYGARTAALATLAERISSVPDAFTCLEMFDELVEKARQMPGEHRAEALTAVVSQLAKILQSVGNVWAEGRGGVVHRTARALEDILRPGLLPLLILEQVPSLPAVYHKLIHETIIQRTQWTAMSPEDLALNTDAALSAFSRSHSASELTLKLAMKLKAGWRAANFTNLLQQAERDPHTNLIEVLSRTMRDAHDPELLQQGFTPLLRLVGQMKYVPSLALADLAEQLPTVPDAELETAWPEVRSLADQVRSADLLDLDRVIAGLAGAVPRLKSQMQDEALASVQQSIPRLFKKKNDWGACNKALATLASALPVLPEKLRQGTFETVLKHVGYVLAADRQAKPCKLKVDNGKQLHEDERGAALLAQLAHAASSLPGLAPRAAVSHILAALQNIRDEAGRAEALKSLACGALPTALERPVTASMRTSDPLKRHVSRELLLNSFINEVEALPPQVRVPALRHMLEQARVDANGKRSGSSDDKSRKLLTRLEDLMRVGSPRV